MEMCFHGNQLSWGIKHPIISLYSKYHSPGFICLSTMLAPVIPSLDEIYCIIFAHVSTRMQRYKMVVDGRAGAYNLPFHPTPLTRSPNPNTRNIINAQFSFAFDLHLHLRFHPSFFTCFIIDLRLALLISLTSS